MRLAAFLVGLVLPVAATAVDLQQVYRDARAYDAQYAAARFALLAGLEKLPQGRALILPTVNLSAGYTETWLDSESRNQTIVPSFARDFSGKNYVFTLSQPIYRPQNWLQRIFSFDFSGGRRQTPNVLFAQLGRGMQQYQATYGRLPQVKVPAGPVLKRRSNGKRVDHGDALTARELLGALRAFKRGEFDKRLRDDLSGVDAQISETFNTLADQLQHRAQIVLR